MKKWITAILLFDLVAGLLFLGLWEQGKAQAAGGIPEGAREAWSGKAAEQEGGSARGAEAETVSRQRTADPAEENRKIALTFDDGPHPYYTEQLLDGLKERGVVATFFVTGEHAALHPDVIKRMQEDA